MAEPKPLAAFVSKLCRNAGIVSVLKEYLEEESGEPADEAVSKLTSGEANQGEQESAADYLSDFVHNEATEETLFYASSEGKTGSRSLSRNTPECSGSGCQSSRESAISTHGRMRSQQHGGWTSVTVR